MRPDGERYHALDPEPYAWVHATLAESIVRGHRLFCSPRIGPGELEVFWAEWRRMGRLVGVRYEDLPESWPGLLAYFDEMVENELEDTEAAQDVLASLHDPAAPPLPVAAESIWRLVRWPSDQGRLSWRRSACCRRPCASGSGIVWSPYEGAPLPGAGPDRAGRPAADAAAGEEFRADTICAGAGGDGR